MTVSSPADRGTLPRPDTWTERSIPEWFARCDKCKKRRIHARYHEFHGARTQAEIDAGALVYCWWRECMDCSFATVNAWGAEWRDSFLLSLEEELEETK